MEIRSRGEPTRKIAAGFMPFEFEVCQDKAKQLHNIQKVGVIEPSNSP